MATQKSKAELEAEVKEKNKALKDKDSQLKQVNDKIAQLEEMMLKLTNQTQSQLSAESKRTDDLLANQDIAVMNLTKGQVNISRAFG